MIEGGTLETPRLLIQPFEQRDAVELVALFADPAVARYVDDGGPLSPEDAALWVVRSRENVRRHGYGTGAVVEKASGRLIGWAGFARPDDGPEQIIYGLSASCWRRGFGGEIVTALIDFADRCNMSSVIATVHPANRRSIGLLLGRGFVHIDGYGDGDAASILYRRDRTP